MPILFKDLPATLRVPGVYGEMDASLAGSFVQQKKALLIGQKFSTSKAASGEVVLVTNEAEAAGFFGAGSELALMCAAFLKYNRDLLLYAAGLDDAPQAQAAQGSLRFGGTVPSGSVRFRLGDKSFSLLLSEEKGFGDIARDMVGLINHLDFPVEASLDSEESSRVLLEASHKGQNANKYVLETDSKSDGIQKGLQVTATALAGGTLNPLLEPFLLSLGADPYHYIVTSFQDAANLKALAHFLEGRYNAVSGLGGRAFFAYGGDLTSALNFGQSLNSPHITVLGIKDSPTPEALAATINGALVSKALSADPAANLSGIVLEGIAPRSAFSFDERQKLLCGGVATFTVTADSRMVLERQITTYQRNAAGIASDAYLDIQTPETLDAIRATIRAEVRQRFSGYKLAQTDETFAPGLKIMTPNVFRGFLLDLYRRVFVGQKAWTQDYESYKETLIVEKDPADKTRLIYRDEPTLIGQFYISTGLIQFK